MIGDDKLIAFRNDVEFAKWEDTLNTLSEKRKPNGKIICSEFKVNGLKVQVTKLYGMHVVFLNGNKIIKSVSIFNAFNNDFEKEISDFFEVSFGTGREIYRSLMSVAVKHFRV